MQQVWLSLLTVLYGAGIIMHFIDLTVPLKPFPAYTHRKRRNFLGRIILVTAVLLSSILLWRQGYSIPAVSIFTLLLTFASVLICHFMVWASGRQPTNLPYPIGEEK